MKQLLLRHEFLIRIAIVIVLATAFVTLGYWLFERSALDGAVTAACLALGALGMVTLYWVSEP